MKVVSFNINGLRARPHQLAALIDKQATLTALGECVGTVDPTTKITVQGHTAAVSGGDPQGAVDYLNRVMA